MSAGSASFAVTVTAALGGLTILQAGLNRMIGSRWGLVPAVFLNSLVLILAASAVYGIAVARPDLFPPLFQDRGGFRSFSWWYLLPGLCGLCLVMGIPWAIGRAGATPVFVTLVAAQMVASLAWDRMVEGQPLSPPRLLGAALAIAGALLAARR
ncbi:MAG: DMT family transporter [Bdellovibrionales bacterium]|nr:DMT family transporter [Bdellovibrionales bacterium]